MKIATPTMVPDSASHYVTLDSRGVKEEVLLSFSTTWRSKPVTVRMNADRYTSDGQLINWRVYAERAREGLVDDTHGTALTDLARRQLGDACRPLVKVWLEGEAYTDSEREAYTDAIKRCCQNLRPYSDDPTRDIRELIERFASKIGPVYAAWLRNIATAYDDFSRIYNGL